LPHFFLFVSEFFRNLMNNSKREFHEMFKKTYGVIYLQHSFVFTDFFEELERYYNSGRVRLAEALDTFFGILYQRMFTVINAQYQFDDRYLECVAEHMTDLKPFGDIPHKLGIQLRRSFVATRAFYKALAAGADVVRNMGSLTPTERCGNELARMQHCDKCLGIKGTKSCSPYCLSILKSCLENHILLDNQWNNFVDALDKVADRITGAFNIEMVVEPINIKISEAVMIFQENGVEVSQKIFTGCGNPALQRRRRQASTPSDVEEPRVEARRVKTDEDEITFETLTFNEESNNKSKNKKNKHKKVDSGATLEKLIRDIKQRVKDSRQFWSQLPYQMCNNEAVPPTFDGPCWNGTALGKYEEAVPSQTTPSPSSSPPILNQQTFILQALISKLQAAYQGQDVDLADDTVDSEDLPSVSGSGSGMGLIDGSGDHDDFGVPEVPRMDTGAPQIPTVLPSSTHPPEVVPASASINSPTLTKALAHYLLPIILVWIGGAFSDLLL
ncbi:glypican-6-like, partial [Photinus pyralis]|uniref:glypican-6-like n=1 Tax=Photinus pyralis TaxID=7054 RepID=UPI00126703B2